MPDQQRTLTYFVADLHLGAAAYADPLAAEREVVDWLDNIAPTAKRLYLMGDVLDYWYEYRYVVPRGFVRFLGTLARMADSGIEITWFIGNHDIWIFDYLPRELGIRVVDGFTIENLDGARFFLSHGDGLGCLKPGFRLLRTLFRNRLCQYLFAAIHPRWTVGFAHEWSASNRRKHFDDNTEKHHNTRCITEFTERYSTEHPGEIDYFIFGHYHIPIDRQMPDGHGRMIVLGDWLSRRTFGIWDGKSFILTSKTK